MDDTDEIFHDTYQEIWELEKTMQNKEIFCEKENDENQSNPKITNNNQNKRSKSTLKHNEDEKKTTETSDPCCLNSKSENFDNKPNKSDDSLKIMNNVNGLIHPTIAIPCNFTDSPKVILNKKNKSEFSNLHCIQHFIQEKKSCPEYLNKYKTLSKLKRNSTENCVWVIKFSPEGKWMASGGSDALLRVYELNTDEDSLDIFNIDCLIYKFHQSDIIDLSWSLDSSKILTGSMDYKTILWERGNPVPLKVFRHIEIITCCSFSSDSDSYFYTGSFDKVLRLWDVEEEKVVFYTHTPDFITAMSFSPNKSTLILGFNQGYIRIYKIDNKKLELITEIQCKNKRKNLLLSKGKKVTNIQFIDNKYFLVTTNDSRIRMIDASNYKQIMKYKGFKSDRIHIKSDYCFEREMILSGSEDGKLYIWNRSYNYIPIINPKYAGNKKNRNSSYEAFFPFEKDILPICAVFLPAQIYGIFRNKLQKKNKEVFCDLIFIVASNNSQYKIFANLIKI